MYLINYKHLLLPMCYFTFLYKLVNYLLLFSFIYLKNNLPLLLYLYSYNNSPFISSDLFRHYKYDEYIIDCINLSFIMSWISDCLRFYCLINDFNLLNTLLTKLFDK
jgi:hypothetical protein